MKKYKTLFHIDEMEKINLILSNIENTLIDLGEKNVDIELVANSEAVSLFNKTENLYKNQITNLAARGVAFVLCANAMRKRDLTKEDVFDFVEIVPSGSGELVKKQSEGWAYIKP